MTGADRNTIVENDRGGRAIVAEHPEQIYLAVGTSAGAFAMFVKPAQALAIAGALIAAAGGVLETQFRKQLGSP
jgi:hypothetical protein